MINTFQKLKLMTVASLLIANQSMAGFDITRMTTVVDDLSGSYTVSKSGRLNDLQFDGTSLTEFNNFHPGLGDNETAITGTVNKQTSRSIGLISTTADGDFNIESNNGAWDVSFSGLVIEIIDFDVELTGSVLVNGENYDAGGLPAVVARTLSRVFWLTRR